MSEKSTELLELYLWTSGCVFLCETLLILKDYLRLRKSRILRLIFDVVCKPLSCAICSFIINDQCSQPITSLAVIIISVI